MNELARRAWVEVSLENIAHNIHQFKLLIPKNCQLMAVVKANGYGHGDLEVARTALANGASWLAVAIPEEGLRLRRAGIAAPILVLGAVSYEQLELCIAKDLAVTVFQWEAIDNLANLARKLQKTARIHVKIDTGMGRLGIYPEETISFITKIKETPGIELQGISTHFASAEHPNEEFAKKQWQKFAEVLDDIQSKNIHIPLRHCSNTAATLYMRHTHLDMVRIGLGMYGMYPKEDYPVRLKPAFSLKAEVTAVRRVSKGTPISYNSTYITKKETNIVVLTIGYADGLNRLLSDQASVLIRGIRFPIVGRITMDHCMVDVGDYTIEIGEEVTLIGKQDDNTILVDEWAKLIGTINYEIPCMVSERVNKIYLK